MEAVGSQSHRWRQYGDGYFQSSTTLDATDGNEQVHRKRVVC